MADNVDQDVIQCFNQLQRAVTKLQRSEVTFGQSGDTLAFRRRIEKELTEAEDINKKLEQLLTFRRQSSLGISNNANQFEKMLKQYESEKERYEKVSGSVRTKMKQITPVDDGTSNTNSGSNNNTVNNNNNSRQTQQQTYQEFVAIVGSLEEQEKRVDQMEQITQDVEELQEAFQDLNEMVNTQQQDINTLEKNVNDVQTNVQQATINLTAAERYQKLAREKQCYILLCCFIILAVIILSTCLPKGGFCHLS